MRIAAPPKKTSAEWVLQLINIVFLLLLFFIVNGTIASMQEPGVLPPRGVVLGTAQPLGDTAYVGADGVVKFRGAAMSPEGIRILLRREAAAGDIPTLLQIVADRKLKASRLVAVLQEFRAQGFENLSLITLHEPEP